MFTIKEIEEACAMVYRQMPPTPQYSWPLINQELGIEIWVKHENHTPTGAFKVRGGITFIDWLKRTQPKIAGICTATRGNHGQSQARAATAAGLTAKIYVPEGNSPEKNAAMSAFGADVVIFGKDFDEARLEALRVAEAEGLAVVPPFHRELAQDHRTAAAVAVALDDPQRQQYPAQGGRHQGRRSSGLIGLDGVDHDGAVFLGAQAGGPGGGEAACLAHLPRHAVPDGKPDAGEDGELPRAWRRAVLSQPHQGH
jgi:hypothetical protein